MGCRFLRLRRLGHLGDEWPAVAIVRCPHLSPSSHRRCQGQPHHCRPPEESVLPHGHCRGILLLLLLLLMLLLLVVVVVVVVGSAVVLTPPTRERVPAAAAAAASSTSQPPVPHVPAPRRAFPRARPCPLRPCPPLRPRPRRCVPEAVPRVRVCPRHVRVYPRQHTPALPCVPRTQSDASVFFVSLDVPARVLHFVRCFAVLLRRSRKDCRPLGPRG